MRSLLIHVIAVCSIQALENPVPSSHLQPRNFNPHPYHEHASSFLIAPEDFQNLAIDRKYEALSRRFQNTGPVQFPDNPPNQQRDQQRQDQQRRIVSHIVDNQALLPHPYERLALNHRSRQLQRFSGNDDQLPQIYLALGNHARRVKNNEFQQNYLIPIRQHNRVDQDYHDETDPIKSSSSNHEKKQYRFSYAVKDGQSGDDFSHTQNQESGGAVHGSYKVQLPDGRVQIVKYTADDLHGYRAEVTYEGEPIVHQSHAPAPPTHHHQALYPQIVKQVEINNIRHTVTPTPYLSSQYNIQAPPAHGYYPSTTAIPKHYY